MSKVFFSKHPLAGAASSGLRAGVIGSLLALNGALAAATTASPANTAASTANVSIAGAEVTVYGAQMPFLTLEAEAAANTTNGTIVRLDHLPVRTESTPAVEASGRAYVELAQTGSYVEFPVTAKANAIVVRHNLPDAPQGGGVSGTLSLYVNGEKRQALPLNSAHSWLYDKEQADIPAEGVAAWKFWDETRFFITGGVNAGDTLRLQKDPQDQVAYYRIDCIDLEEVGAPLPAPAAGTFLSVTDFGAVGNGTADDTDALEACIAAAKAAGKVVWLPAGSYGMSRVLELNGVHVQGAGMWYTVLTGLVDDVQRDTWLGYTGFALSGSGAGVSDLTIDTPLYTWRSRAGAKPITARNRPENWRLENLWITHSNTGVWVSNAHHGVVRGCRIYSTYADGININGGSSHVLVENNFLRGTGDDSLAILSELHVRVPLVTTYITMRNNTAVAPWLAGNFDLAGGHGHLVENNLFEDGAGVVINFPASYHMHELNGSILRNNLLVRSGANFRHGQKRGAIWVYPGSTTISNLLVQNNVILSPLFRGIHMTGEERQDVVFEGNRIDSPGEDAILIESKVKGSGVFVGNTIHNLRSGFKPVKNLAGEENYPITAVNNSWQ